MNVSRDTLTAVVSAVVIVSGITAWSHINSLYYTAGLSQPTLRTLDYAAFGILVVSIFVIVAWASYGGYPKRP